MNQLNNADSSLRFAALSDRQLLNSLYVTVLLALLVPPFVGGTLMMIVGFYPMLEFYLAFISYTGVYVVCVVLAVLSQVPRWHRGIVALTELDHELALERAKHIVTRLPVYLILLVTVYSIFGALSADFSLESMGIQQFTLRDHLYNQFGLIPVVLITTFPIFFYFVDRLGRYLGPRDIHVLAIPLWVKVLMLGIVIPVLIDSLLIGYYYNRTGYFQLETLVLWLSLIMLALGGTWMAWRSLHQSINPLKTFLAARSDLVADVGHRLIPVSLDELGILTAQFDRALDQQRELSDKLKYERDYATSLVNTVPMIVLLMDARGYIQYINPYFEQLSGYSLDEVKDKEWFATFLPERDQDRIRDYFHAAVHDEPVRGNVNPIVIRGGEERQIEWSADVMRDAEGAFAGLLSIGQDVTERKISEQKLLLSEARLNEAQKLAKVGSWELNLVDKSLVWSDEIFHIFEIDKSKFDASYEAFLDAIHPDDRDRVNRAYTDSLVDHKPYEIVHRLQMADGRIKHVRETCESFFDGDRPVRSLGTIQDITDMVNAEAKLARYRDHLEELVEERTRELHNAQEELVRKERLATLGQLTATVSHELRNPLGAMRPSLFILNKCCDKNNERSCKALSVIDRNIDRCDHIIDELLDFTRITDLERHTTRIDQWLESIVDEQNIANDIELKKDFSLDGLELDVDTDRLQRAVINVIDNACQAMLDETQKDTHRQGSRLEVSSQLNGQRVEITVSDNGVGIPDEIREKIFEPLFSTKVFGVGLGMPTIRQIMQQHGGSIEIDSKAGEGTAVTLWLPLQ